MSVLIVAEKPSVARDIARVLGVTGRGEGYLHSPDYIVTWALGHLVGICDPGEIEERWKKWRREDLPILPETLPVKVLPGGGSKQYKVIRSLMLDKNVTRLICATDAGREGELIFRLIYRQAGCTKPFDRLWISSMTDAAIRDGFAHLKPSSEYDALYMSALCRSEADWLVGMNASRAFTLHYNALLSIGRVQTPTLALIVRRDEAIERFVPKDYWVLMADFGDYKGVWLNMSDPSKPESRSYDKAVLEEAARQIRGKTAVVRESKREMKRARPPQLYDLTTLQREANTRYGFSAKKTLDLAQALYERHKLLTYPRTDSRYLPDDMAPNIAKTLGTLEGELVPFAARLLPAPPHPKRVYDNTKLSDHHAIVPTGVRASTKTLSQDEKRLFDMVARRLIASLYPDYEYESAQILTGCEGHLFRSEGNVPVKPGWRELYADRNPEDDAQDLPRVAPGDERTVHGAKIEQKKEKPPARMTEASLLAQMEQAGRDIDDETLREAMKESGIGTPATRAATIERLIEVGYVKKTGKTLIATPKGRSLIAVVPVQMTSAETTGRWERALNRMAKAGGMAEAQPLYDKFMGSIRRYSTFLTEAPAQAPDGIIFEKEDHFTKRRSSGTSRKASGTAPRKPAGTAASSTDAPASKPRGSAGTSAEASKAPRKSAPKKA